MPEDHHITDSIAGSSHKEDFREGFREKYERYANQYADEEEALASRSRAFSAESSEAHWEPPRGRLDSPVSESEVPQEEADSVGLEAQNGYTFQDDSTSTDSVGLGAQNGYTSQDDSTSSDSMLSHTARTYGSGASRGRKGKGKVSDRTNRNKAFQEESVDSDSTESYAEISLSRESTRKRSTAKDTETLRRSVTSAKEALRRSGRSADSIEGTSHTEDFRDKAASIYASRAAQASRDEVGRTDPNEAQWQKRSASPASEKAKQKAGKSWYIDRVPLETYFEEDEDAEDPDISRHSRAKLYEQIANQVAHSTTSRDKIYKRLSKQGVSRSEDFREERASPYFNYDRNPDAETSGKSNEATWQAASGRR
jgi:hypothetical protein